MEDTNYTYFKRKLLTKTGVDLNQYKPEQMLRRLGGLMTRAGAKDFVEYWRLMDSNEAELKRFMEFFTINVSEFFRDLAKFDVLRTRFVPELLKGSRHLRVWSAGCSHGAEAYSLAIMLTEMHPSGDDRITATDIDMRILSQARAGASYTEADLKNVNALQRQKFFSKAGQNYQVSDAVKRKVDFKLHDLLRDPFESGFDLVLCRNVVIYFTDDAKAALYKRFSNCLRPGGLLFVGATEMIPKAREIGLESLMPSFYRRLA